MTATDEELFARFRDHGDEAALAALVERYWKRTFSIARSITGESAGAEDAAQQAFVRVVAAARRRETVTSFAGWLRSIVVTEARNERRSSSRRAAREARAARSEVVTATASVREHVEALPEKLRVPIVLHYAHGFSQAEVAEALRCPVPTASSWIRRGLEELRVREGGASVTALEGLLLSALGDTGRARPRAPATAALLAAKRARAAVARPAATLAFALGATALVVSLVREPVAAKERRATREAAAPIASAAPDPTRPAVRLAGAHPVSTDDARASARSGFPASSASALGPELLATLEPDRAPGPYPWEEPAPTKVEERLRSQKLTFNFAETPVAEVVETLHDFLGVPVRLEPRLEERTRDATIRLRVRDVLAEQLVAILCDQLRGPGSTPGFVATDEELVLVEDRALDPRARPSTRVSDLVEHGPGDSALDTEARGRLARSVVLRLERAPLDEALGKLAEVTELDFVPTSSVPAETLVDAEIGSAPASVALDTLLAPARLAWELHDGTVLVTPASERPLPVLGSQRVSLDLRGALIEDLVASLRIAGVEAVASREAWRSRGTFSLVFSGTVSELAAAIGARTPFGAWIAERTRDPLREVLVLSGSSPGAREVLGLQLPGRFPGIVAEANELRARLVPELLARAAARGGPPGTTLDESEARVARTVARIVDLSESARSYEKVPEEIASWRATVRDHVPEIRAALTTVQDEAERDRQDSERERARFVPGSAEEQAIVRDYEVRSSKRARQAKTLESRLDELTRGPTLPWVDPEDAWKRLVAGARLGEAEVAATRR